MFEWDHRVSNGWNADTWRLGSTSTSGATPPTARSVSASWDGTGSTGWQHISSRARESSCPDGAAWTAPSRRRRPAPPGPRPHRPRSPHRAAPARPGPAEQAPAAGPRRQRRPSDADLLHDVVGGCVHALADLDRGVGSPADPRGPQSSDLAVAAYAMTDRHPGASGADAAHRSPPRPGEGCLRLPGRPTGRR